MNLEPITTLLLATMTSLATNRYNILPTWYYRYAKTKPFTCMTCMAFWWGAILSITATNLHFLLSIPMGLASAGLTVLFIKLSER